MRKTWSVLLMAALLLLSVTPRAGAQIEGAKSIIAGLLIAPNRVVFEGRTRVAEMYLVNNSNLRHTYAISLANFRISESGAMVRIPDGEPVAHRADTFIRYSPRRVVLEPGKQQVVRLQLMKPTGLADGEYRSYIVLQMLPDPATADYSSPPQEDSESIKVNLMPVYGLLVPLIVHSGVLSASVAISDLSLVSDTASGAKALSLTLVRSGNQSVYGDLVVDYVGTGKPAVRVGKRSGIPIYVSQEKKSLNISLTIPEGITLSGGNLLVRYLDPVSQNDKKNPTLASANLELP